MKFNILFAGKTPLTEGSSLQKYKLIAKGETEMRMSPCLKTTMENVSQVLLPRGTGVTPDKVRTG